MGLFSFTQEIAIDLGTANTVIIHNDKIVVDEPSVVALDKRTDKLLAVGEKARLMHGKTHENIRTIRPLRDGVIADFYAAERVSYERQVFFKGICAVDRSDEIHKTYYDIVPEILDRKSTRLNSSHPSSSRMPSSA